MNTNERRAFLSIEMLLVIGVVVTLMAVGFNYYKKIQANQAQMQLTQDIAAVTNGLDRYKGATGAYPYSVGALLTQTQTGWNQSSSYISADIADKWNYNAYLNTGTNFDTQTNTAIGYVTIKLISADKYPALKTAEIRDILRGKCLNGLTAVSGTAAITNWGDECVLNGSTVLYNAPSF